MGLAGRVNPTLNVLAKLASQRIRRLAFKQRHLLFQFFGLGLEVSQAGLPVPGVDAIIGSIAVGDQGPLKSLAQHGPKKSR
jgi:hypothetical protein